MSSSTDLRLISVALLEKNNYTEYYKIVISIVFAKGNTVL